MGNEERIQVILKALNVADTYSFLKPVEETDAFLQQSYSDILGEEALEESLKMAGDPKYHLSRWDSLLKEEINTQNLSNADALEIIRKIEKDTTRNWMLIFLVNRSSALGEMDFAESLVSELPEANEYSACQYVARRIILRHLAAKIDFKEFKKRIKECLPAKFPKNEIVDIKKAFILGRAKSEGWKKALEISKDKLFGTAYQPIALYNETKNVSIVEMNKLIDDNLSELNEVYLKAKVFVKYAYHGEALHPADDVFEMIYNEIEKVDSAYKEDGNKLRDMLAFDLGCSTTNLADIKRCKKLISNPMLKRELGYHEENSKKIGTTN